MRAVDEAKLQFGEILIVERIDSLVVFVKKKAAIDSDRRALFGLNLNAVR